jgi:3-methylfumaryl-CoA hydratase
VSVVRTAPLSVETAEAFRGTFAPDDAPLGTGDTLPAAWDGVYFPFTASFADLRPDGTPARDGVIPEIDLPRRMYAGEDTEFVRPLRLGAEVTQTTSLGSVVEKNGRSGRLVFVDVVHEYAVDGEVAVRSVWHDVFLDHPPEGAPVREPRRDPDAGVTADWIDTATLDIRQLFRFSALTFNTHLVHYDRTWARGAEGLPDLLVHGPLTRILLMDAARRHVPGRVPARLSVTAVSPTFVDREVRYAGRTAGNETVVTALDADDVVLATATITWA